MSLRRMSLALVLVIALLLMASLFKGGAAAETPRQESDSKAVLFVVSSAPFPSAYIVPFVIIERGEYKQPVAGDSDASEITSFSDGYYSKGRKYRVLFGGGEAGSLTVTKSNKDEECARTSADVTLRSTAKLNRNVMAIATNSSTLGKSGKNTRRSPTPAERAALLTLVRDIYKQKGVPAALLPSLTTVNLTALDLNGDGNSELVGSFVVKKQKGGAARYALFLFAEPEGKSYRTTVLQYDRITKDDIMSGAEISAIENGVYLERLVDALDLDGDGTSEVITQQDGFEGDGYFIYKKQSGKWNKVYEFSNYRCAF